MGNELVTTGTDIAPADMGGGRIAEIEHVRNTDIDRYWREGLDKEYGHYLRDSMGQVAPTDHMDAKESHQRLSATEAGQALVRQWSSSGRSFEASLVAAQREAGKFVRALGDDRAQRAFMERFDRSMPELLRFSIYVMLITCGDNAFVRPADAEGIAHFSQDTAGAALVEKWASDAGMKIARIWRRAEYLKMLTGGEIEPLMNWYDQLTDKEATSVLEYAAR